MRPLLAFVCAMPMELRPLRRRLDLRRATIGGIECYRGHLGGRDVVAVVTGMGTALAADATERLLDAAAVEQVVVVGITGAIDDVTPIGTVVVPEVVVHAGTGSEHRPTPMGDAPPHGTMWTTDDLITDADALAALRARGVVSLDMETAAVGEVCERRGVPWSVFRVISDRASDGSVDEEVFAMSNQDGTPNPRAIARYVLTHPHRLPSLARLARGSRLATERAADTAVRAVSAIAHG